MYKVRTQFITWVRSTDFVKTPVGLINGLNKHHGSLLVDLNHASTMYCSTSNRNRSRTYTCGESNHHRQRQTHLILLDSLLLSVLPRLQVAYFRSHGHDRLAEAESRANPFFLGVVVGADTVAYLSTPVVTLCLWPRWLFIMDCVRAKHRWDGPLCCGHLSGPGKKPNPCSKPEYRYRAQGEIPSPRPNPVISTGFVHVLSTRYHLWCSTIADCRSWIDAISNSRNLYRNDNAGEIKHSYLVLPFVRQPRLPHSVMGCLCSRLLLVHH